MKILVRAPNWVGDAVIAIPALEAIRRTHAAAEIAILAPLAVADLYRDQPFANTILEYDKSGRHKGWWGREKLIVELRRGGFHLAILLQNAFEAARVFPSVPVTRAMGAVCFLPNRFVSRKRETSRAMSRITIWNWFAARAGSSPVARSRRFVCAYLYHREMRRKRCCCAPGQEKAPGVARSPPELPTARPSAGRRSDSRPLRTA